MKGFISNASIEGFKRGYLWDSKKAEFICLICGEDIGVNNEIINDHMSGHGTPTERLLVLDKKH